MKLDYKMKLFRLKNRVLPIIVALAILTTDLFGTVLFSVSPVIYHVGGNGLRQGETVGGAFFQKEEISVEAFGEGDHEVYFTLSGSGFREDEGTFFANTSVHSEIENRFDFGFDRFAKLRDSKVSYQLFSAPRVEALIKDVGTPLLDENILIGRLSEETSQKTTVPFYIRVAPGQNVRPGVYEDRVRVSMFAKTPVGWTSEPILRSVLRIHVVVPRITSVSISDPTVCWQINEFLLGIPKYVDFFSGSNVSIDAKIDVDTQVDQRFHVQTQLIGANQFRIKLVPNSGRNHGSERVDQSEFKPTNCFYTIQIRSMD